MHVNKLEESQIKCPRCGGEDFREHDCGPDGYDDDVTWTSYSCTKCGLWHSGWSDKWLINVESWSDEEDAKEYFYSEDK